MLQQRGQTAREDHEERQADAFENVFGPVAFQCPEHPIPPERWRRPASSVPAFPAGVYESDFEESGKRACRFSAQKPGVIEKL